MRSGWRVVPAAVALMCGLTASSAPALAATPVCGSVITADTTLDGDLSCPGDGLVIDGPGVVLDLNGHTLGGAGLVRGGTGVRLSAAATDAVVRNGRVNGFGIGIDAARGGDRATISGVSFLQNGYAVRLVSDGDRVEGSQFLPNPRAAILVRGRNESITGNAFRANPIAVFAFGTDGLSVLGNSVVGDRLDDSGIFVGYSSAVRVSGNSVSEYAQRSGIAVISSTGDVSGNQVFANGTGISIEASDVRVSGNLAFFNRTLGIDAPGAIDGGGNRAFGNVDPRQCVGVACTDAPVVAS